MAGQERWVIMLDNPTALAIPLVILFSVLGIAYLLLVTWFAIWIARDAYNRGHEGALWSGIFMLFQCAIPVATLGGGLVLPALLLSWIFGLLVYFYARRQGSLVECDNCLGKMLSYAQNCPHCGMLIIEPAQQQPGEQSRSTSHVLYEPGEAPPIRRKKRDT
jgi:hypothetical protein